MVRVFLIFFVDLVCNLFLIKDIRVRSGTNPPSYKCDNFFKKKTRYKIIENVFKKRVENGFKISCNAYLSVKKCFPKPYDISSALATFTDALEFFYQKVLDALMVIHAHGAKYNIRMT